MIRCWFFEPQNNIYTMKIKKLTWTASAMFSMVDFVKHIEFLVVKYYYFLVGHCHPTVVEAVATQMALTNANNRFLHPGIIHCVEKLQSTLPAELNTFYIGNSGFEIECFEFKKLNLLF